MTYRDAIGFLYGLRLHGLKLGLENTRRLAAMAGSPQERLQFIHVAGTNGKGSTCAMLESVYRAAGLRVGLFTSPHLISFRERIQVDREWISEHEVVRRLELIQPWLEEFPKDHPPTFFEVVTVMALAHFAERGCDVVLWETGMGGRLDATNIVRPVVSVITNIQFDHQKWLGTTRGAIAAEKAGIIKPGVPVLTAADEPEALEVIRRTAEQQGAPLRVVESSSKGVSGWPAGWSLPLAGAHQQANAMLALAVVDLLRDRWSVETSAVRRGLESVRWPGRMQWVSRPTGGRLLLDGAHNVAGMEALVAALAQEPSGGGRPVFVLGMMSDKDWPAVSALVARAAERVLLVPIRSDRSASPQELAEACKAVSDRLVVETRTSLAEALEAARSEPWIVVTGSLYLVGEAMELLGLQPVEGISESRLNDWSSSKSL